MQPWASLCLAAVTLGRAVIPPWQCFFLQAPYCKGAFFALLALRSMWLAAQFFHTHGNKAWNAGSLRCIRGEGRSARVLLAPSKSHYGDEGSSGRVAAGGYVRTCAYWFLQGYVSSLGFASWAAGDVRRTGSDRGGCALWARINFRCSIAACAKPVPVLVSLQPRITPSLLVSWNDGKCPSHETPLQYISRPTHQPLLISPSKTLNVKPWAAELLLLYLRESHSLVLTPKILQLALQHNTFSSPSP